MGGASTALGAHRQRGEPGTLSAPAPDGERSACAWDRTAHVRRAPLSCSRGVQGGTTSTIAKFFTFSGTVPTHIKPEELDSDYGAVMDELTLMELFNVHLTS